MASRYAVATANWSDTAAWSATDGGASGASVPTAADDVFFTATSGSITVTLTGTASCRSLDCNGFTGTITGAGQAILIGDATSGSGNRALRLASGMTFNSSMPLFFESTSGTTQTITLAGKTVSNMTFEQTGSWQLLDACTSNGTVTLTKGTLNLNGQTCNWSAFVSSAANTRVLSLNAATITCTSTGTAWNLDNTGLTFTTGAATLNLTGSGADIAPCPSYEAWDTNSLINITGAGQHDIFVDGGTLYNLTFTGTAAKTDELRFSGNKTISGTFTVNGNSSINRVIVDSTIIGTARTITSAANSFSNVDFMDITGAGAGSWDFSELTENYNDNSTDTVKWTDTAGGQIAETNSELEMTTIMGGNYVSRSSNNFFNLTGSYVSQRLVNAGNQSLASLEAYPVHLAVDSNNSISIMISGNTIYARKKISGASSTVGSTIAYDSSVHKYFKIAEAGGSTYWQYSTDGVTYSNITIPVSNPLAVTSLQLQTVTGTWNAEASTTTVIYDDFVSTAYRLIGDCGGNSGITFPAAVSQTWSGTSGANWSANAWTNRVPLPQDNVSLAVAFSASQTVTADMPRLGKSIDWTGASGSPTFTFATNTIYGSLSLVSGMTTGGFNTLNLAGRGSFSITSSGVNIAPKFITVAPGGTYTLNDALTLSGDLQITNGTFNSNNFNISCTKTSTSGTSTKSYIFGTSVITLVSTTAANSLDYSAATGLTLSASNATFVISGATANTRTIAGGGQTYGTLTYILSGSTGELDITGSNSFAQINFSDASNARSLKFTAGTTTTIRNGNGFNVQGTSGKLMTVASITAATHTLSGVNRQSCNYLSLTNSIATGGGAWYAGANSTDGGGNTGWLFSAAPPMVSARSEIQNKMNLLNLQRL